MADITGNVDDTPLPKTAGNSLPRRLHRRGQFLQGHERVILPTLGRTLFRASASFGSASGGHGLNPGGTFQMGNLKAATKAFDEFIHYL